MRSHFCFSHWRSVSHKIALAGVACGLGLALTAGTAQADTAADQYQFASGLYGQKLYSLAADKLRAFLQANPKDPNAPMAAYQLGAALYRSPGADGKIDYVASGAAYESALNTYPNIDPKIAAAARFELAEGQFQLKNYAKVVPVATQFLKSPVADPGQAAWALYYLGESEAALKQPSAATSAYKTLLTQYPASEPAPYAAFSMGSVAEDSGDYAGAAAAFKNLLTNYPNADTASEARLRLGDAELAQGQWTDAGATYQAVLNDPHAADWRLDAEQGVADSAFGAKDWAAAAQGYRTLLGGLAQNDSGRLGAQLRLADSLFNDKQWDAAVNAYGPVIAANQPDMMAHALYFRAGAERSEGHLDAAANDYRGLIAGYPKDNLAPRAELRLGDTLTDAKDVAGASAAYRAVITGYPGTDSATEAQGDLVSLAGQVSRAPAGNDAGRQALEKVLEDLPPGAATGNARYTLAQGAYAQQNWTSAADLALQAFDAETDPAGKESAIYLVGAARLRGGDSAGAIGAFQKELGLFPNGKLAAQARLGLTWAFIDAGKWTDAQGAARAGLAKIQVAGASVTDAQLPDRLQLALGEALLGGGQGHDAEGAFVAATGSANRGVQLQAETGAARSDEKISDFAAAAGHWGKVAVLSRTPSAQGGAYLSQGLALEKAKSPQGALTAFQAAVTADPKGDEAPRALYEAAWTANDSKDPSEAALWTELATNYPQSDYAAEALFHEGELKFAAGDFPGAATIYQSETTTYPDAKVTPLAWYKLGSALYKQSSWGPAADAFDHAAAAQSEVALESGFWAADAHREANQLDQARAGYAAFIAGVKTPAAGVTPSPASLALLPRAFYGQGLVAEAANDWKTAATAYGAAQDGASPDLLPELLLRQGRAQLNGGDSTDALNTLLKVTISYPASSWAPEARWLAGNASESTGEKTAAIAIYQALAADKTAGDFSDKAAAKLKDLGAAPAPAAAG